MIDRTSVLTRWQCPNCGEECVSQDADAVAHLRATHHCPTAEQINRALRGEFDG